MSCTSHQIAVLSAARRHVADAEGLLGSSPDQAWHLAGFGPECVRKAAIFDTGLAASVVDRAMGHLLGESVDPLLDWAVNLDRRAHRYELDGWTRGHDVLGQWSPNHRYEATGTARAEGRDVEGLVSTARERVDRVTVALWMDGCLPSDWSATS